MDGSLQDDSNSSEFDLTSFFRMDETKECIFTYTGLLFLTVYFLNDAIPPKDLVAVFFFACCPFTRTACVGLVCCIAFGLPA